MEFVAKTGAPAKQRTACAIIGVFEGKQLSASAEELDKAGGKPISTLLERGDFRGELGEVQMLPVTTGVACERILVVGCGSAEAYGLKQYRKAVTAAATALKRTGARDAVSYLSTETAGGLGSFELARHGAESFVTALYEFSAMKSEKPKPPRLRKVGFAVSERGPARRGIELGRAIGEGMTVARELGNLPSNVCTPSYLASRAKRIGAGCERMKVRVLGRAEMKRLGMGALLSVTAGSRKPPKLIVMEYRGKKSGAPVALVGKGITFDTGGISMKPPQKLDEMKFDMCGAAAVLGTMHTIAALEPPMNVVALVPTCENMPDGEATNPGDIVTSMSGKTVEILNTDAEGRLILCDALTYSRRFKPAAVIDVATLTGACVIALGSHYTGLMSYDDDLADNLLEAGLTAADPAWRLPLAEEYDEQLKSPFADFANVGNREGGAITAGCFLGRFTKDLSWAHLDVAGTAWTTGRSKGASGRPVPLLVQYLLDRMESR